MSELNPLNLNPHRRLDPAPEETALGHGLTVAKIGAIAFPPLGTVTSFLELFVTPQASQRMSNWYEDVRSHVNELIQKVDRLTPESLANDEAFLSAFLQATQSAVKSHRQAKREALRNAVLNVVLGKESNPDRQQQFLALVDRFSETHLAVLMFVSDPEGYFRRTGSAGPRINHLEARPTIPDLVQLAMPNLKDSFAGELAGTASDFIHFVLGELVASRLAIFREDRDTWSVPDSAIKSGGGPLRGMATHLGQSFLAFISEPKELMPGRS